MLLVGKVHNLLLTFVHTGVDEQEGEKRTRLEEEQQAAETPSKEFQPVTRLDTWGAIQARKTDQDNAAGSGEELGEQPGWPLWHQLWSSLWRG